ncbi:hypothetical protein Leryth_009423 [Lithospermum erythrorhizon]|nr:hypothetical protein Leryth_009423 [Lithospermum erythrorhizon]
MFQNPVLPETSAAGGGEATELENNEEEELRKPFSCKRWPHEETLALLKIRSQMNHAFTEAAYKAPLWDEISRKMGEIGYHRSAKKCKEKFENLCKYNRRTKEGRPGRENGKSYRFCELLQVFDNQSSAPTNSTYEIQTLIAEAEMAIPSTSETSKANCASQDSTIPCLAQDSNLEFMSISTSSKSSSEKDSEGSIRKKRRITSYLEKLMTAVLEKQQDLQNKFLEAIDKHEKYRLAREEAWRAQEMARINKELALLAQERALVAAKDTALIALLQKLSGQEIQVPVTKIVPLSGKQEDYAKVVEVSKDNNVNSPMRGVGGLVNVGENWTQGSSSRWPKDAVEALVRLRSMFNLHDNGPKAGGGHIWEEISSEMKKLGYDKNSKKCKEKWENINKYYKRVKYANRKRPEDSKTCPYYHLLENLYENKSRELEHNDSSDCNMKPEYILMEMMTQEQRELQQSVTEHGETHIYHCQGGNQDDTEDGYHSGY